MKNIDLNAGGVIGAIICGGAAAAIFFATIDVAQSGRVPFRLIILALIGGAAAGNYVWWQFFKKPE